MSIKVGYISDWESRLLGRLYIQHKGKPVFTALVTKVIAPQAQDLEESAQSLFSIISIDDSEGVNLDVIGQIVGELRAGFDDPTYRLLLRTRIAANRSNGRAEDIYTVMDLLFAELDNLSMRIIPGTIAEFVLHVDTPLTDVQAGLALGFLLDAKSAGVRAILEYQLQPDDETFTFEECSFVGVALSGGETQITLLDWTNLDPSGGTVTLDPLLSNAETLTYSSILPGGLMQLTMAVAHAHAVHAEVAQTFPASPGLGWGDSSDPTVGGDFASAVGGP